jgi:GNAT superfamily N-acetyltransferase
MNPFDETPHTDDFFVSTDKHLLNMRWLVANLLDQPWTKCWGHERMAEAIANSLTFGVYERTPPVEPGVPTQPKMVGFARVITDGCTYSLVCDVVIDPLYRGKGLAKFLMAVIVNCAEVRRTVSLLRTSNAQKLYARFGYQDVTAMRRIPTPSHAPRND